MTPIFQRLEFSYPDGERFWDRSGELAIELRKLMPRLRVKSSGAEQRDFVDEERQRDIYFGITTASFGGPATDDTFIPLAAEFLKKTTQVFELEWLRTFTFRHVLGRRCESRSEAEELFWPMVGPEAQSKLKASVPEGKPQAFQAELRVGALDVSVRFAIVDLPVQPTNNPPVLPHLTAAIEVQGSAPIRIAEFDVTAFMKNVATKQAEEILGRIAPHLHEPASNPA